MCTDERDRIYALASMASDLVFDGDKLPAFKFRVHVDYALNVQQTFQSFTLAYLEAGMTIWEPLRLPRSLVERQFTHTSETWPS
jgi:hypothetical protein